MRDRLIRRQLDGPSRGRHRLVHAVHTHEDLGELGPESGRVRIALQRLLHEGDRVLEPTGLNLHLGLGVGVVSVGAGVGTECREPRHLVVHRASRGAAGGAAREHRGDEDGREPAPGLRHQASGGRRGFWIGDDGRRRVDLALGLRVERRGQPNARAAGRRLGLDLARDESEGANRPEPLSQAAGQLVASKRELVEPR